MVTNLAWKSYFNNDTIECCYHHVVMMTLFHQASSIRLILLHQTFLPLTFWNHAKGLLHFSYVPTKEQLMDTPTKNLLVFNTSLIFNSRFVFLWGVNYEKSLFLDLHNFYSYMMKDQISFTWVKFPIES